MSDIILQVEDLRTSFFTRVGEFKAVDGVSFYVRGGETFGLVGESAYGKTVTGLLHFLKLKSALIDISELDVINNC